MWKKMRMLALMLMLALMRENLYTKPALLNLLYVRLHAHPKLAN